MEQTSLYNLNQWVEEDRIQREDFNADNAKIEAALALLSSDRVVSGRYTGNGITGRTISLPFTPQFLILLGYHADDSGYCALSFVTPTTELCLTKNNLYYSTGVSIVENGFQLNVYNWHNAENRPEQYIAFK